MMTGGGRVRDAGRRFGEETLEAVLWSAVEDRLLTLPPDEAAAFLDGLEDWGEDLLARWHAEVDGFRDAFEEDERAGRLDRIRELARGDAADPVPGAVSRPRPIRLFAVGAA